ncbi:hypothetical protein M752DRAFT_333103 [Aspergillus phoenicis ATCC 13157]|uniref:Nudix hydrolase domain-containing protein n=1 Tax=Aspergillus phoenicis ATCC 13157 TaxID=1353007 RepID=A0A370PXC2_ASPPH|nr:hypothetical protein M752DRAFT_333103 [Aspergillus phoenicis ATCC 13157]
MAHGQTCESLLITEQTHYELVSDGDMDDQLSTLTYNVRPPIDRFEISTQSYLSERTDIFGVVSAAIIIHNNRVLLIQRASDDDYPNLWEVPGGEAHKEETLVQGAVRELREEAGLRASEVISMIGEFEWVEPELENPEHGERIWKIFMFLIAIDDADMQLEINLDPKEHQAYLWATETQIRESLCGTIQLEWMSINQREAILSAFEKVND